jgi:hypothetical protein
MGEFGCFLLSFLRRETPMKTILAVAATAAILGGALMMPNTADAKGCLKGATVGAVAGHMVGSGHGAAGAATGCAVGHHEANKKDDKKQQEQDNQQHANSQNGDQTKQ